MRFVSEISFFWWIIALVGSIIAAWYFYKNQNWLDKKPAIWRKLLTALRALLLFFIIVLLLGVFYENIFYKEEKPLIINVVDNSSSMLNYSGSKLLPEKIKRFQSDLMTKLGDKYELVNAKVGSSFHYGDTIQFNEQKTNLALAFEQIQQDYYGRNIGAIVLSSDGNHNDGNDPFYAIDQLNFIPIYTLTVGDTVYKKDQWVKHVFVNDFAFLGNDFPVEVDLESTKMLNESATVSIQKGGKTLQTKGFKYDAKNGGYGHVSFQLNADKIGIQKYEVVLSQKKGEYTFKNNIRTFYIEVMDARTKVLILSQAPHPDITAIKNAFSTDKNTQVQTKLISDWNKKFSDYQFLIWHEPGIRYDGLINKIRKEAKIPTLFIIGPNTSAQVFEDLNLGKIQGGGSKYDEVQFSFNKQFQQFEISEVLQQNSQFYPPLNAKFGKLTLNPNNQILAFQRIGSIDKKEPMMYFGKSESGDFGVIYGEGVWKWRMNEFVKTSSNQGFDELFHKLQQYLVVKKEGAGLRVKLPEELYKNQEIIIDASFYNESMELINLPEVEFKVSKGGKLYGKYQFSKFDKSYKLTIGKLSPGKYDWSAQTKFNGKNYQKKGVLVVEEVGVEQMYTSADQVLLRQLSNKSKGKNFHFNDYAKLFDAIAKNNEIASVAKKEVDSKSLVDWLPFLLVIIILYSTELILRRYLGTY